MCFKNFNEENGGRISEQANCPIGANNNQVRYTQVLVY